MKCLHFHCHHVVNMLNKFSSIHMHAARLKRLHVSENIHVLLHTHLCNGRKMAKKFTAYFTANTSATKPARMPVQ